eukprot:6203359-Pleurochrysis_carterae.AAC.1
MLLLNSAYHNRCVSHLRDRAELMALPEEDQAVVRRRGPACARWASPLSAPQAAAKGRGIHRSIHPK